jgi:hypothetical protein
VDALRYLRERLGTHLAIERERPRGKNRPICEEIWVPSKVLQQGNVRNLRQMAAVKATFVILSSQIRKLPATAPAIASGPFEPCSRVAVASLPLCRSKAQNHRLQSYTGAGLQGIKDTPPLVGIPSHAEAHLYYTEG